MDIPKELQDFTMLIAKSHRILDIKTYQSKNKNFEVKITDILESDTSGYTYPDTPSRINKISGIIEISRPKIINYSNDFVYYIIIQLYILLKYQTIKKYTNDYCFQQADIIALKHCEDKRLNVKLIIKEFIKLLKETPIELNKGRFENIIKEFKIKR
ncbi:MAG: hypothetical protein DRJ01_08820 [Bacteroidetes bacterium]|nr:MAG: hypothetical protein DRJ01_08820 [Bacteroidota bacterium]